MLSITVIIDLMSKFFNISRVVQTIRKAWSSKDPSKLFLLFAIPFIFLFILIIPVLQGWDESTHFLRAYEISEFDVLASEYDGKNAGYLTPVDIIDLHDSAVGDQVRSSQSGLEVKSSINHYYRFLTDNDIGENRVDKYFTASAVYSPVSYIPQSTGIFIARTVKMPLLTYVHLGRLLNAVVYILLCYIAIRVATRGKWVLFVVAMLPTSITTAATLSPDAIIIGGVMLLVALFLKAIFDDKRLSNRYLLTIVALALVLSLTKQAYFVFAGLFLFVPPRLFGGWKRYLLWNGLIIGLALVCTLGWAYLIRDITGFNAHKPGQNVMPEDQIKHIVSSPFEYIGILTWHIIGKSNGIYMQLVGHLTGKGVLMPLYMIFVSYVTIILAFVVTRYEDVKIKTLKKTEKLLATLGPLLIAILTTVLIYTALYLAFTVVGSSSIDGVQGRYFIPLIPLLIPISILCRSKSKSLKINEAQLVAWIRNLVLFQSSFAIIAVFATCYIPHIKFI